MEGAEPRRAGYTIGEAAKRASCSPAMLRLWEREGLITSTRTGGGHRIYGEDQIDRLRHIAYLRRVQGLNTAGIRRALEAEGLGQAARSRGNRAAPLGPELRNLRRRRALTLQTVADATELSISFLSSVERDQAGISMASLRRLIDFYGVTLSDLLSGDRGESRVTRPGRRRAIRDQASGITIEQLAEGPVQMEAQLFYVEAGGGSRSAYTHEGEEFIYVLEGSIEVSLGGTEVYPLEVGDCLYFPSMTPHSYTNRGERTARLLWVNTPPTF